MKHTFTLILILFTRLTCFGQTTFITEDSAHIFWQPSAKLSYKDFKGTPSVRVMNMFRKYNMNASASVGIWSVLDVPKRKKDRGKKLEKVYFAPAFDKRGSSAISPDTMQIAIQAVYFDICEFASRLARRDYKALQDTMKGYGTLYIMFSTIEKDMQEEYDKMIGTYTKEVIVDNRPGAYESWRKFYDEMLEKTKEWATKPEECYRLLTGKPIDPDYEKSPKIVGAIK
jgi:hypothetical protein